LTEFRLFLGDFHPFLNSLKKILADFRGFLIDFSNGKTRPGESSPSLTNGETRPTPSWPTFVKRKPAEKIPQVAQDDPQRV